MKNVQAGTVEETSPFCRCRWEWIPSASLWKRLTWNPLFPVCGGRG